MPEQTYKVDSSMSAPRKADVPMPPMPELQQAFEDLERAISFAGDRVSLLEDRLSIVMKPEKVSDEAKRAVKGGISMLTNRVYSTAENVTAIALRVDALISRLDF